MVEVDQELLDTELPGFNRETSVNWTVIAQNRKWFSDDVLFLPVLHLFL